MNTVPNPADSPQQPTAPVKVPLTREQLYELVWAAPMLRLAETFGISSSYMARVCTELRIPRPGPGYWTQLELGRAPERPALPSARPGDMTTWEPGISVGNTQQVISKQKALGDTVSPASPSSKVGRRPSRKLALPGLHPLVKDAKPLFLKSREKKSGLLNPFKRMLVDIISSPELLDKALETANALFLALTKNGHQVMLAPSHLRLRREDITIRETQERNRYYETPWAPDRPTVLFIDDVCIGLTLYETLERVDTVYVNGVYLPIRDLTEQQRRRFTGPRHWTATDYVPSGRMVLQAHCASSFRVSWMERWKETKSGELRTLIPTIVSTIEAAVPELKRKLEIAKEQAEIERLKWEEERRRMEQQRQREREEQARKTASHDLMAAISAWDEARKVESYFSAVLQATEDLEPIKRDVVLERVRLAKQLVENSDPLEMLLRWKAPHERL